MLRNYVSSKRISDCIGDLLNACPVRSSACAGVSISFVLEKKYHITLRSHGELGNGMRVRHDHWKSIESQSDVPTIVSLREKYHVTIRGSSDTLEGVTH